MFCCVNSPPPGQNERYCVRRRCIFLNENNNIPIRIWLKLVSRSPIDNKSPLVQLMTWRRTGDKPLPEAMPTQFTDGYMWRLG